jgi:hypothetical protein
VPIQLLASLVYELMREVEDEDGGTFDGIDDGRVGDEVVGKANSGEVLDVLMEFVYEGRKGLRLVAEFGVWVVMRRRFGYVYLFFVNPHLDLGFEQVWVFEDIFGNDF